MTVVLLLLATAVVVAIITRPLIGDVHETESVAHAAQVADLEAEKAARYREIRDLELDHATGKVSDEDWRATDRQLRADAAEILHQLDELGAAASPTGAVERTGPATIPPA